MRGCMHSRFSQQITWQLGDMCCKPGMRVLQDILLQNADRKETAGAQHLRCTVIPLWLWEARPWQAPSALKVVFAGSALLEARQGESACWAPLCGGDPSSRAGCEYSCTAHITTASGRAFISHSGAKDEGKSIATWSREQFSRYDFTLL